MLCCDLPFSRYSLFRRPKLLDFGDPLGAPSLKGKKTCSGPICRPTIMQNFTPIGATVTEISVTGQRKNTGLTSYTLTYSTTLCMVGNKTLATLSLSVMQNKMLLKYAKIMIEVF